MQQSQDSHLDSLLHLTEVTVHLQTFLPSFLPTMTNSNNDNK